MVYSILPMSTGGENKALERLVSLRGKQGLVILNLTIYERICFKFALLPHENRKQETFFFNRNNHVMRTPQN